MKEQNESSSFVIPVKIRDCEKIVKETMASLADIVDNTSLPAVKEPQNTIQISQPQVPSLPHERPQQVGDILYQQILSQRTGTLTLTPEQEEILYSPFTDEEVHIKPDGSIYLSWSWFAERLRKAFGLGWQLVPDGDPKKDLVNGKPTILWKFALLINGICMGVAYGEHQENRIHQMSYGDMTESAKSNALMRLCKGIGMSLKLWNRDYAEAWKEAYAKTYKDEEKNKIFWRKLTDSELQIKKDNFIKALHALNVPKEEYYNTLKAFGYNHSNEVRLIDYKTIWKVLREKEGKEGGENEESYTDK